MSNQSFTRAILSGPNGTKIHILDANLNAWYDLSSLGITDSNRRLHIEQLWGGYVVALCTTEHKALRAQQYQTYTLVEAGTHILDPGVQHIKCVEFMSSEYMEKPIAGGSWDKPQQ